MLLAFGLLTVLVVPSCEVDYLVPVETEMPDTVKFSVDILPIFNAGCNISGCHSSGGYSPNLTEEYAYIYITSFGLVDTANAESSILYQRLISTKKPMPPEGNLPANEIELILEWIRQGAFNN